MGPGEDVFPPFFSLFFLPFSFPSFDVQGFGVGSVMGKDAAARFFFSLPSSPSFPFFLFLR